MAFTAGRLQWAQGQAEKWLTQLAIAGLPPVAFGWGMVEYSQRVPFQIAHSPTDDDETGSPEEIDHTVIESIGMARLHSIYIGLGEENFMKCTC